jgi:hypothetical protein
MTADSGFAEALKTAHEAAAEGPRPQQPTSVNGYPLRRGPLRPTTTAVAPNT